MELKAQLLAAELQVPEAQKSCLFHHLVTLSCHHHTCRSSAVWACSLCLLCGLHHSKPTEGKRSQRRHRECGEAEGQIPEVLAVANCSCCLLDPSSQAFRSSVILLFFGNVHRQCMYIFVWVCVCTREHMHICTHKCSGQRSEQLVSSIILHLIFLR